MLVNLVPAQRATRRARMQYRVPARRAARAALARILVCAPRERAYARHAGKQCGTRLRAAGS